MGKYFWFVHFQLQAYFKVKNYQLISYLEVKFEWQISYHLWMVQVRVIMSCQKCDFSLKHIKQDRFTTCFKNLWNNPLGVLVLQKKKSDSFKNQTGYKTSRTFGTVKPVSKYVTKPLKQLKWPNRQPFLSSLKSK